MSVVVENFPDNPPNRQYCLVWTRKVDGARVVFACSTEADCNAQIGQYLDRAHTADANGWKDL